VFVSFDQGSVSLAMMGHIRMVDKLLFKRDHDESVHQSLVLSVDLWFMVGLKD
jgi:hypothetical protein